MQKIFLLATMILLISCQRGKDLPKSSDDASNADSKPSLVGDAVAEIASNSVNLRLAPDTASKVIRNLSKGMTVEVLGRSNTRKTIYKCEHYWFQVKVLDSVGWVYGQFMDNFIERSRKKAEVPSKSRVLEVLVPSSWDTEKSV